MARQLTAPPPSEERAPTPTILTSAPAGLAGRIWGAPLWAHAATLAVVLLALVPLVGVGASFSADEGAAIVQAHSLAKGDGWIVDHPAPQVDPTGKAYPLELSIRGDKGTAPFAKHPLYALLLAGADRAGGHLAMVLLSLAGTVTAALLAAAISGYLRPGLSRPSLWVAGLATPLLFDGYLVIAHTLGAAAAAGAVLLAIRAAESKGRPVLAIAGVAGCIAVAVLLRNEAVFWGLGVGVTLAVVAFRRRSKLIAGAAVTAVVVAGLAHIGEAAWFDRLVGGHAVGLGSSPGSGLGFVAGRAQSLVITWLRPGYGQFPGAELALVVMLGAVVAGTVAARRHPDDRRVIAGLAIVAAAGALIALVVAPTNLVPGLLVAAPVVTAGLVALRRSSLGSVGAQVALGTFTVFALAVAATQYVQGGSGEWGGRYFALGLPVLVPVVLLALAEAGARLDHVTRRVATGGLVVCSLATAAMGLSSQADTHRFTAKLLSTINRSGQSISAAGERPVMLTTSGAVPRLAWATFDRQRWLLSDRADLGALTTRLADAGTERVVLVTAHRDEDVAAAGPRARVVSDDHPTGRGTWHVLVLDLPQAP